MYYKGRNYSMQCIFDSTNAFFKEPFGAVEEGTKIHFKIVLPRNIKCSKANLCVNFENKNLMYSLDMFWCGMLQSDHEMWECHFQPEEAGLYWYNFQIETINGCESISKKPNSFEGDFNNNSLWQITVYKKSFETPNWLEGGIIYQIFPDRFFSSGKKKKCIPKDRTIVNDKNKDPEWNFNSQGKVTNSDYYCGDLEGITKKLEYLKSLGVTCIYLNPIFESHTNHRYDTANYEKVDPLLGNINLFKHLCAEAKKLGIHIIIDGVFSHTGSDSIYFNKNNRYKSLGAYNSQDSPYYSWYNFINWPDQYNSWWGFDTLPEVNELNENYNKYITGQNGIIQKWLNFGATGWRLDVADELPDEFIANIRNAAKKVNKDALIIGEVWEDASNKISYSKRREFLLGNELDSVMNYPFRNAIIEFLKYKNAKDAMFHILSILENYPKQVSSIMMNMLSTHDSERIITSLAGEPLNGRDKAWQSKQYLSENDFKKGIQLVQLASLIQYTLPGVPSIYYGDEIGMEGYLDPFNRRYFNWENQNKTLLSWYKHLGKFRKKYKDILCANFKNYFSNNEILSYFRIQNNKALLCAFNAGEVDVKLEIPKDYKIKKVILSNSTHNENINIPPLGFFVALLIL